MNHENRPAARRHLSQCRDIERRKRVQARGRLVQQQQGRRGDQVHTNGASLPLTAAHAPPQLVANNCIARYRPRPRPRARRTWRSPVMQDFRRYACHACGAWLRASEGKPGASGTLPSAVAFSMSQRLFLRRAGSVMRIGAANPLTLLGETMASHRYYVRQGSSGSCSTIFCSSISFENV
jgi:hypothetical protein